MVIQLIISLWGPWDPLRNNICLGRFVPRHDDELELEVDDPLLVEVQSEDYWYEGYNMRTGARGIFPAYYAIEVTKDPESYKGTDAIIINYRGSDCECATSDADQPCLWCSFKDFKLLSKVDFVKAFFF